MNIARKGTPILLPTLLMVCLACDGGTMDETETERSARRSVEPGSAAAAQEVGDVDAGAREAGADETRTTIRVAGHPVTVEVADAEEERERGLMDRDSLPEDHGMLFVYSEERELSFWMRNTRIPLDIAFIGRGGTIVDIQQMEAQSDRYHTSRSPAMYALEMTRGWFEEHGVTIGDRVRF